MATRMQQRRGTAAQWISTNSGNGPILSPGEIGFESDTNKFKIGDGVNHWVDLTYFTDAESITTALNSIIDGAPAALNTLNELAAALGDDANFLASLATETYVDTAIGNIDALPSQSTNGGKFLTTDGSIASWATVDLTSKQDVVSGVSSTEIGYLDGVTSAIQTQLNAKLESSDLTGYATETYVGNQGFITSSSLTGLATETYVDTAVSGAEVDQSTLAGAGIDWTGTQFAVDTATVFANPTISSGLTLDGTGDFTISADANIILDATTEVYIGSAATGNEVATKSYADAKLSKSGGTMTGDLTLAGSPSADLHAVTKAYVDNIASGINFHQAVRVATTANITLSGTQTIDEVSLSVGDRVLVKDQTDQKQNGIYVVASSTWSRAADADNTPEGEFAGGDFCLVLEGTVNSGYGYVCSNTSAITIGSTNITYTAFNAAKAVVAGSGLAEYTPGEIVIAIGGVQSLMIADETIIDWNISQYAEIAQSKISGLTSDLAAKAPLSSPTFTGTVDFTGATVTGISSYSAPTLGSTSISSGATVTSIAGLTKLTSTTYAQLDANGYEQDIVLMNLMGAL